MSITSQYKKRRIKEYSDNTTVLYDTISTVLWYTTNNHFNDYNN